MPESILVSKDLFRDMVSDFEKLLHDFELIAEQDNMKEVNKRLREIKEGKVKGLTEKDLVNFMKKEGVNVIE